MPSCDDVRRLPPAVLGGLAALAGLLLVGGCGGGADRAGGSGGGERAERPPPQATPSTTSSAPEPSTAPSGSPPASADRRSSTLGPSDGRPQRALLSIPALQVRDLLVVPYRGETDDTPGSAIQDRGHAASPFGPNGGVGPGGVGNYQVTAHRTSSTRAFEFLPDLTLGQKAYVESGGVRYVYRIVATRKTSFRSPQSLREQRAPVPGRPGVEPTKAMITLSTCLTPEDHAAGNWWSDEHGNPEHRVDKIGELVAVRPA